MVLQNDKQPRYDQSEAGFLYTDRKLNNDYQAKDKRNNGKQGLMVLEIQCIGSIQLDCFCETGYKACI